MFTKQELREHIEKQIITKNNINYVIEELEREYPEVQCKISDKKKHHYKYFYRNAKFGIECKYSDVFMREALNDIMSTRFVSAIIASNRIKKFGDIKDNKMFCFAEGVYLSKDYDTDYVQFFIDQLNSNIGRLLACQSRKYIKEGRQKYAVNKYLHNIEIKRIEKEEFDIAIIIKDKNVKIKVKIFNKLIDALFSMKNVSSIFPGALFYNDEGHVIKIKLKAQISRILNPQNEVLNPRHSIDASINSLNSSISDAETEIKTLENKITVLKSCIEEDRKKVNILESAKNILKNR